VSEYLDPITALLVSAGVCWCLLVSVGIPTTVHTIIERPYFASLFKTNIFFRKLTKCLTERLIFLVTDSLAAYLLSLQLTNNLSVVTNVLLKEQISRWILFYLTA
jgi:hypothetical protein